MRLMYLCWYWYYGVVDSIARRFSYTKMLQAKLDEKHLRMVRLINKYDALSTYVGEQGAKYAKSMTLLAADIERQRKEYVYPMRPDDVRIAEERYL